MLFSFGSGRSFIRRISPLFLVFCFLALFAVKTEPAFAQTERNASGVVGELASGDFDAVVANFNARLQREMPAAKLAQLWQSYLDQYGYYQSQLGSASNGGVVIIRCQMQKGAIDIRFVFEGNGRIAQFGIGPMDTSVNIKPPT